MYLAQKVLYVKQEGKKEEVAVSSRQSQGKGGRVYSDKIVQRRGQPRARHIPSFPLNDPTSCSLRTVSVGYKPLALGEVTHHQRMPRCSLKHLSDTFTSLGRALDVSLSSDLLRNGENLRVGRLVVGSSSIDPASSWDRPGDPSCTRRG